MTKYLIVGPARSGTTVTQSVLRSHPETACFSDEVKALRLFENGISGFTFQNEAPAERDLGFRRLVELFASLGAGPGTRACGFKCAIGSVQGAKVLVERIRTLLPDFSIILNTREDVVAQYGSAVRARRTGVYHTWRPRPPSALPPLTLSTGLYTRYFLDVREITATLRSLGETNRLLELSYEQDIMAGPEFATKLYRFLGVAAPEEPLRLRTEKVSPPPRQFIANYDELKRAEEKARRSGRPNFSMRGLGYDAAQAALRSLDRLHRRFPVSLLPGT